MKTALSSMGWIVLIYVFYCGILFFLQRQMLFPRHIAGSPPYVKPKIPGMERIWLDCGGKKVESWLLPAYTKPYPVVIFAHGNGEIIDIWAHEMSYFNKMGLGVLLVEYPGYGRSQGKPTQKSVTETFVAAYDMLLSRNDTDSSKIIFFGRSLGGGAVCQLAKKRKAAAIILMSCFTSARSFARSYFAPGFLVLDAFDNLSVIKNYKGPALVIHGKYDEVIPYSHGKKLAKAAKAQLITYDCGHNDCPPRWDIFWQDIKKFLMESKIIRKNN